MFPQIPSSPNTIIAVHVAEDFGVKTVYLEWCEELSGGEVQSEKVNLQLNSDADFLNFRNWISEQQSKLIFLNAKDFAHQIGLFSNFPKNCFDIGVGLELGATPTTPKPMVSPLTRGTFADVLSIPSDDNLKTGYLINAYFFLKENLPPQIYELWKEIESPLAFVLAKIENYGVYINKASLEETAEKLSLKVNQLQEEILGKFGEIFSEKENVEHINLNSPAQLGEALKKAGYLLKETKTGKISTDRAVLEELLLTDENNLIQPILDYRTVAKLSSTYTQTFLQVLDENSRIHTQYNQLGSATGRISSNNPNLQNIPIRNPEYGPLIRSCFAAEKGNSLICADYSQIELRLLAHFCGDEVLTEAFALNQDIHQRTASEIFDVPLEQVTKQQRRLGKTLNFALVYQQGSFATAVQLGISQKEAAAFINKYFAKFSKVKPYIESTIAKAKETGYVETLFGRRRYFENLNSSMVMLRKLDERAAFNAVLQGSNADLIKKAMILLDEKFQKENLKAQIVLQVHDELVVECSTEIAEKVSKIVVETMQLNQPLKVPVLVEAGIGNNWKEGKE